MHSTLVQPATLAGLHCLDVISRAIVDGLQSGMHRSPLKGHSTDFADHRAYVPGDDLRHLDWKVLGRRDRLVLKRYEAETDFACTLVVDGSASMSYQGRHSPWTKYRFASVLGATLAYLVTQQQDRAGLQLLSDGPPLELPPQRQGQFERICQALEHHQPAAQMDLDTGILHLTPPTCRRGLVIIISDLLVDLNAFSQALAKLRHRGHDLAVFWTLDPDELNLDISQVSRFVGLEGEGEIVAEPRALRQAWKQVVESHRQTLAGLCRAHRAILVETDSATAPQVALNQLLVSLEHG